MVVTMLLATYTISMITATTQNTLAYKRTLSLCSKVVSHHWKLNHRITYIYLEISREKPLVVMESSSVWYTIYRYLSEERCKDVVLSNTNKAIASAKVKTNKQDPKTG
jgi:hypothetical protein